MRGVVGAVADGAHGGKGQAPVGANLRHGGAFHLYRQRVGQLVPQRRAFGGGGDEAVAADDQALVHLRRVQPEFGHRRRAQRALRVGQRGARGLRQAVGQRGVGGKARTAGQRHLVAREQRRGVEVVLQQLARHHHVAYAHGRRQRAGHAGKHDRRGAKALDQQHRAAGGGHLADARQAGQHRSTVPVALPHLAPGDAGALLVGPARQHVRQFVVQRRQDGDRGVGGQRQFGAHIGLWP